MSGIGFSVYSLYDSHDRTHYCFDDWNKIWKIDLKKTERNIAYVLSNRFFDTPSDQPGEVWLDYPDLDWVTKNLYFFHNGSLQILNLKDSSKPPKSLVSEKKRSSNLIVKVLPNDGYIVVKISGMKAFNKLICYHTHSKSSGFHGG